jgi:hypothetical protein
MSADWPNPVGSIWWLMIAGPWLAASETRAFSYFKVANKSGANWDAENWLRAR